MSDEKQTLGFQTEVKQLLQLMIHSLYSNKEIFLRELISNASDACDKLRFEAIRHPEVYEGEPDLIITVDYNEEAKTICICDSGVGMDRDEVIANIGTIARSGTKEFFQSLTGDQAADAQLIGQFGVGFYSAFIVAQKVELLTRKAGLAASEGVLWSSDGQGEFSIEQAEKPGRGTQITLHLREDESEWLSSWRLQSVLRKYSDYVAFPIKMRKETWDEEAKAQLKQDEWEVINQASAIWARPKSEISEEQYQSFYGTLGAGQEPALAYTHNVVEGRSEYTQLLYIPGSAPMDLWDRNHKRGLKLYVKRVFIMEDVEQFLPAYLRFVKGVIDTNDLPLNVSREILQDSRDVKVIREGCTKKILSLLASMTKKEPEKYQQFWGAFGRVMKEGTGEDFGNRDKIAALLRFASTDQDNEDQVVSLEDYIARMKEGQTHIYYVTADTFLAAKNSPHLEVFRKKGIEVLLLSDRVDEWLVGNLPEFQEKQLRSVTKGGLDLGDLVKDEEQESSQVKEELQPLLEKLKQSLGGRVKEVRVTFRLTESPACLVTDDNDMSANLSRILKSVGQTVEESQPILEINPHHFLIKRLITEEAKFSEWSLLLFEQALLSEGGQLEDPATFVRRMNEVIMTLSLSA